jgi:hypothetical protein
MADDDWFDDDDDDDGEGDGTDTSNSDDSEYGSGLGSDYYAQQLEEMLDRFNAWLDASGFDRATNLDEEVNRIIDGYRVATGDLSGLDDFKMPSSSGPYGLFDRNEGSEYRLMDPVDPRAFDYVKLEIFAWDRGYRVTASTEGTHGEFSFHTDGRAIDVSVQGMSANQIEKMKEDFSLHGIRIYDESDKSKWTENTTGYHLHADTGTVDEVIERQRASREGLSREDIGLSPTWPPRLRIPE